MLRIYNNYNNHYNNDNTIKTKTINKSDSSISTSGENVIRLGV